MFDRKFLGMGLLLASSLFLSGCLTVPTAAQRLATADSIGEPAGFKRVWLLTSPFQLTVYKKIQKPGQPLHVYIEGDGYAWVTRNRISGDPTPRRPTALELAALDPSPNVLYIARPCQYTPLDQSYACDEAYWTGLRFSEEVIQSMDAAVQWFVDDAKIPEIHLIGYSGGAAVAALIAARRDDVASLRTVAGNLDPKGLCEYHHVSVPDAGTLNPMDVAEDLSEIPQTHFVGMNDRIVPESIAQGFVGKMSSASCARIQEVEGADHVKGWAAAWPQLLSVPLVCSDSPKKS